MIVSLAVDLSLRSLLNLTVYSPSSFSISHSSMTSVCLPLSDVISYLEIDINHFDELIQKQEGYSGQNVPLPYFILEKKSFQLS